MSSPCLFDSSDALACLAAEDDRDIVLEDMFLCPSRLQSRMADIAESVKLRASRLAGDSRVDVAIGVLYEARRWAWEISGRLPIEQDWQRETDCTVTTGVRFLP